MSQNFVNFRQVGDSHPRPSKTEVDNAVVFLEEGDEGGDVEAVFVGDAGEGLGAVAFGGEEAEAVLADPGVHEVVELGVAGVACGEAFGEHFAEFELEAVEVGKGGGAGGHEVLGVLFELEEVEVVAAVFDAGGALESGV